MHLQKICKHTKDQENKISTKPPGVYKGICKAITNFAFFKHVGLSPPPFEHLKKTAKLVFWDIPYESNVHRLDFCTTLGHPGYLGPFVPKIDLKILLATADGMCVEPGRDIAVCSRC